MTSSSWRASWKTMWLKKLRLTHLHHVTKPASTQSLPLQHHEEQGPWDTVNHSSLHAVTHQCDSCGLLRVKEPVCPNKRNRVGHFMTLHVHNPAMVIKDHRFKGSLDYTGKCWLKENNEGLGCNLVVSACRAPLVLCSVPRDRREGEPR